MTDYIKYRAHNGYDAKAASDEVGYVEKYPSKTIQSMAADCDINELMRRFGVVSNIPVDPRPVMFGDFTEIFDFRTAQDAVIRAREAFMGLPADLRSRFGNDPQQFLEFCEDESNRDELGRLGLLRPGTRGAPGAPTEPSGGPVSGGGASPAGSAGGGSGSSGGASGAAA